MVSQYCTEKIKNQAGGPAVSRFLEPNTILNLCKKPDLLLILENKFRELKNTYLPLLEAKLGLRVAKLELSVCA